MEFSVWVPARVELAGVAARAEALGFARLHVYDSPLLFADAVVSLALCARETRTIELGHGVTNPCHTSAPLMACSLATLNQLAPGRTFLGIGTGNTARRTMGLGQSSLADVEAFIRAVRALTRGEAAVIREGDVERSVQFIHGEDSVDPTFVNLRDPVPVYLAADGPRGRALAGELADGLIYQAPPTEELLRRARQEMAPGAERAGRDLEQIPIQLLARLYVLEDGETFGNDRMKRIVMGARQSRIGCYSAGYQPWGSSSAGVPVAEEDIPPLDRPLVEVNRRVVRQRWGDAALDGPAWYRRAYEGHAWRIRDELLPYVTDEMLRAQAVIGTADELLGRIRSWEALGVRSVGPMCLDSMEHVEETVERFGREIVGRY